MAASTNKANADSLPSKVANNGYPEVRGTGYGEVFHANAFELDNLARDGELFQFQNAAQGTGVTVTANTTQAAAGLTPAINFTLAATATKSVTVHRLRIRMVGIGSGHTALNLQVIIAQIAGAYSVAGTDYLVRGSAPGTAGYHNVRSDLVVASQMATLRAGIPTVALGTLPSLVAHWQPRTATIPVAGDEYMMNFGGTAFANQQSDHAIVASTTANYYYHQASPCIVAPGGSFSFGMWGASMAGTSSIEWEMLWSER